MPSPSNPYFYLSGNIVYFLGIEKVDIKNVEMGLYTTINPVEKIDIDAPFPFPDELLSQVKRGVTDLARYSFFIPRVDIINDGAATTEKAAIGKVQSVNDQQNQEE